VEKKSVPSLTNTSLIVRFSLEDTKSQCALGNALVGGVPYLVLR